MVHSSAWQSDGLAFYTGMVDGKLARWSVTSSTPDWILPAHTDGVDDMALFDGDRHLITQGRDGQTKIRDLRTLRRPGPRSPQPGFRAHPFRKPKASDLSRSSRLARSGRRLQTAHRSMAREFCQHHEPPRDEPTAPGCGGPSQRRGFRHPLQTSVHPTQVGGAGNRCHPTRHRLQPVP